MQLVTPNSSSRPALHINHLEGNGRETKKSRGTALGIDDPVKMREKVTDGRGNLWGVNLIELVIPQNCDRKQITSVLPGEFMSKESNTEAGWHERMLFMFTSPNYTMTIKAK